MKKLIKLDIGAGYLKHKGYLSVDIRKETKPDIWADFEKAHCLRVIKTSSVEEVLMSQVFEHIKDVQSFMKELYRVCANGAKVYIACPYYSHHTAVEDPTHVRFMTERSMMYFDKKTKGSDGHYISIPYNFKETEVRLVPDKKHGNKKAEQLTKLKETHINIIETVIYSLEVVK